MTTDQDLSTTFEGEYAGVPEHLRYGLLEYVQHHHETGGFLMAVFSNDLRESMGRADEISRAGLFDVVKWLYNVAPSTCWGSPERVSAWLAEGTR